MDTAVTNLGPFHGQFEGHARVYVSLALAEVAGLIVAPWLTGWIALHYHPAASYTNVLPASPGWLALIDGVGVLLAWSWYSLYRRLSAKIAAGAPGFAFLDRIRLSLVLMAQTMIALVILIAIKIR
jgi:hypothetical protein